MPYQNVILFSIFGCSLLAESPTPRPGSQEMKLLLFLMSLLRIGYYGFAIDHHWNQFKVFHLKKYSSLAEESHRRTVFADNLRKIEEHNRKYLSGQVSFWLQMNHFGDLMTDEFQAMINRLNTSSSAAYRTLQSIRVAEEATLPESVDWRALGAVTEVKDQGKCGSCWSFSATGALEAQHFLKTGRLVSLSEQNLIDCSVEYGNDGCQGGLMDKAFEYIVDNRGVDTESSYPYEGPPDDCRFNKDKVGATATGIVNLPFGDEDALKKAVATIGPISSGIDANHHSFQFYAGGVYQEPLCKGTITHAVLIVGYGSADGQDFWLLKNSWNKNWGENGYARVARNLRNHCGIANRASYPLVH